MGSYIGRRRMSQEIRRFSRLDFLFSRMLLRVGVPRQGSRTASQRRRETHDASGMVPMILDIRHAQILSGASFPSESRRLKPRGGPESKRSPRTTHSSAHSRIIIMDTTSRVGDSLETSTKLYRTNVIFGEKKFGILGRCHQSTSEYCSPRDEYFIRPIIFRTAGFRNFTF